MSTSESINAKVKFDFWTILFDMQPMSSSEQKCKLNFEWFS